MTVVRTPAHAPGRSRARHQPAPDLIARWRSAWSMWRVPLLVGVGCTVILRAVTTLVALLGTYGIDFPHIVARHPGDLVNVWAHWDTGYYVTIALHGYPATSVVHGHAALLPKEIAFAPAYPAAMRAIQVILGTTPIIAGQVVSALATIVALMGIVHLATYDTDRETAGTAALLLVAFPTAFFLLADYADSLALAFVVLALVAARHRRWAIAGCMAVGAFFTKYYLLLVVAALLVEVWEVWRQPPDAGEPEAATALPLDDPGVGGSTGTGIASGALAGTALAPSQSQGQEGTRQRWLATTYRVAAVGVPGLAALISWMLFCNAKYGDALAFVHVQAEWGRHFAFPWTLAQTTASDLIHLRFLDTSTASVMELFDAVTVIALAVLSVYCFLRVRRSYGILLFLALCTFTFETILYSETREVLALFPFFIGLARWVGGSRWRERLLLALFLPSSYYLVWRFVTGRFAG